MILKLGRGFLPWMRITPQKRGAPPPGCPLCRQGKPPVKDPGIFLEKTDRFLPGTVSPLFSVHSRVSGHPGGAPDPFIIPFFATKETLLNCTVFSRLKRPISQNTCI